MSEAQRRKFHEHAVEMNAEAQSMWELCVYDADALAYALVAGIDGDAKARRLMGTLRELMRQIDAEPMPCLLCDNEFGKECKPVALVLLNPLRDNPQNLVGNGVCEECAARYGDGLIHRVAEYYKQNMLPDLRVVPPISGSGLA